MVSTPRAPESALEQLGRLVRSVRDEDLDQPTPCKDWSVSDLVDHIVRSTANLAVSARGGDADWSGATPHHEDAGAAFAFNQVKGRLAPLPGGVASFASLLAFFDHLSAGNKRIDLTRLAIRADEQGRHAVEFNLRLVHLTLHEKVAQ